MGRGLRFGSKDKEMCRLNKHRVRLAKGWQVLGNLRGACAKHRSLTCAIDIFLEEGAYTTVASAVAILMALTLVFSASPAIWTSARSADVQVSADASAVAGANVVASFHTAATVIDASILSLGLAGFAMTGVGLVGLLIPGANALAGETLDAANRVLNARNSFARSASEGLQKLEQALPYVVALNATRTCDAQDTKRVSYTGTAIAMPSTSASVFPALDGEQIDTAALEQTSDDLDKKAKELTRAAEETAACKEAAWIADCGRESMNMQERAGRLSGIDSRSNPDYASSITWEPNVALNRARAYYRWRFNNDVPQSSNVEARTDAAARHAFYGYALTKLRDAKVVERDGVVTSNVELLPKNTEEVRNTSLYTDPVWPATVEAEGLTLHYGRDCPGATGAAAGTLALSAIDTGRARECSTCSFSIGDIGKTPAASTSIDNGFEYHLREYTKALDDYVAARNKELELEREAQGEANKASNAFDEAIKVLMNKRPRIAPPGRNGCIAFVAADEADAPRELISTFAKDTQVPHRGAIAAAVLAPEPATQENNVLARFCSGLEERAGSNGAVGLIDSVMDLWGKLLLSYGDMSEGLNELTDSLVGKLDSFGMGPVANWLKQRIQGTIQSLGFDAVDLRLRKPVLTNTSNVFSASGSTGISNIQEKLRSIPANSSDPRAILEALGYAVREYIGSLEFTVAQIPLPDGKSIPLTIRLRDVAGGVLGGG